MEELGEHYYIGKYPTVIKYLLLYGKKVEYASKLMLVWDFIHQCYTIFLIIFYLVADQNTKKNIGWLIALSVFMTIMSFTMLIISESMLTKEEKRRKNIWRETNGIYNQEYPLDSKIYRNCLITTNVKKDNSKIIFIFPCMFWPMDYYGDIVERDERNQLIRKKKHYIYYQDFSEQLALSGYQTVRFSNRKIKGPISVEQFINDIVQTIQNILKICNKKELILVGHGKSANILLLVINKLNQVNQLVLIDGGGESEEQRLWQTYKMLNFVTGRTYVHDVKEKITEFYSNLNNLYEKGKVSEVNYMYFGTSQEKWIELLNNIKIDTLILGSEFNYFYDITQVQDKIHNQNIQFQWLKNTDYTLCKVTEEEVRKYQFTANGYLLPPYDLKYNPKVGEYILDFLEDRSIG